MSLAPTIAVPGQLTSTALAAVNKAAGVHGSLLRFTTVARLEAMPAEIDAAIAELRRLKPQVADLRKAAGLTKHPKKSKSPTEKNQ